MLPRAQMCRQYDSLGNKLRCNASIALSEPDLNVTQHVQLMLEAANWAPTHGKTEPWRFVVLDRAGAVDFVDKSIEVRDLCGSARRLRRCSFRCCADTRLTSLLLSRSPRRNWGRTSTGRSAPRR